MGGRGRCGRLSPGCYSSNTALVDHVESTRSILKTTCAMGRDPSAHLLSRWRCMRQGNIHTKASGFAGDAGREASGARMKAPVEEVEKRRDRGFRRTTG